LNQSLDGLRVLVTRPAHQQHAFIELLKSCSAIPVSFPLSTISLNNNTNQTTSLLSSIQAFDFIIFVSPNAVNFAHKLLPFPWEKISAKIVCVGNASKMALLSLGQEVDLVPTSGFNSESILAMDELHFLKKKQMAIVGGDVSRPLLENIFVERGASVKHITVYKNTCPMYSTKEIHTIFIQNTPDVLCITSNQGILNLSKTLNKGILEFVKSIPLIVNSHRCERLARKQGFRADIKVTTTPGDLGQLSSLQQWYSQL